MIDQLDSRLSSLINASTHSNCTISHYRAEVGNSSHAGRPVPPVLHCCADVTCNNDVSSWRLGASFDKCIQWSLPAVPVLLACPPSSTCASRLNADSLVRDHSLPCLCSVFLWIGVVAVRPPVVSLQVPRPPGHLLSRLMFLPTGLMLENMSAGFIHASITYSILHMKD